LLAHNRNFNVALSAHATKVPFARIENRACACLDGRARSQREEGMQTISAVLAFLAAAFVGRFVARSQIAKSLDNHRWLRVGAFALAFLLVAAILTGGAMSDH
jgi:hypothetical protein